MLSEVTSLDTEVYVLLWQHVRGLQKEQTLHFADDLGEMGMDSRLLLIVRELPGVSSAREQPLCV